MPGKVLGASRTNQTYSCPTGHSGIWRRGRKEIGIWGSPLCTSCQAGPARTEVRKSWSSPGTCRLQSAELVETSQVYSVWTTRSGALRDWAGSQMGEGGACGTVLTGEHMASLIEAGAVSASTDGGQWGCVPRVTRTCSF